MNVTLPLFDGGAFSKKRTAAVEAHLARLWARRSADFLSAAKGYDVVPLEDIGDDRPVLDALTAWSADGHRDEIPPPETAQSVAALAERLSIDGFLVIHGLQRSPNVTTVLTILTASLTWPLIAVESRQAYEAAIVEAATGRIVWRANVWRASPLLGDPHVVKLEPKDLFDGIEHAVPAVLIQPRASNQPVKEDTA